MLAAKSGTFNLVAGGVAEVEDAGIRNTDAGNNEEEEICLLPKNMAAPSSRAFGTASRLPSPVRSIRKSFRTCSWPGQAFISGHSEVWA